MNLCPPSVTVSAHTSAFNAVAFQSPVMPNARMSLWTQSIHSFSFPPRPLRTAPSRFPKTIHFGSCPPLIRRSVPAPKSLLVRNVVSMLSHPVISRTRLYEVIRWSARQELSPIYDFFSHFPFSVPVPAFCFGLATWVQPSHPASPLPLSAAVRQFWCHDRWC